MDNLIRFAVIDDQELMLKEIEGFVKDFLNTDLVLSTTNVSDLFNHLDQGLPIDVILLDINMPQYSGFDIAAYLRENHPNVKLIFMSAYQDYALQGYKYYPEDFLAKPINVLRLKQTLSRLGHEHKRKRRIGIKTNGKITLIDISSILYVGKKGRKTLIYLKDAKPVECSESLTQLEGLLRQYEFFRAHQSYLVAIDKIESIESDHYMKSYNIKLYQCDHNVYLSRHKYKTLKNLIGQHL